MQLENKKFVRKDLVIYRFKEKEMSATFIYDPVTKRAGWAYCSPRDRFDKELGKRIAFGRLNKRPLDLSIHDNNIYEIKSGLLSLFEVAKHNWYEKNIKKGKK